LPAALTRTAAIATLKLDDPTRAPARFLVWRETPLKSYLQAIRRFGAGMRSLLAILLFFTWAEPAAACRRYSIWHYNFPQPCPTARLTAQAALAAPDIPLPDLTEITWGETGDGRLAAIGKLRVLTDAP
jgi:hypothetical protein